MNENSNTHCLELFWVELVKRTLHMGSVIIDINNEDHNKCRLCIVAFEEYKQEMAHPNPIRFLEKGRETH